MFLGSNSSLTTDMADATNVNLCVYDRLPGQCVQSRHHPSMSAVSPIIRRWCKVSRYQRRDKCSRPSEYIFPEVTQLLIWHVVPVDAVRLGEAQPTRPKSRHDRGPNIFEGPRLSVFSPQVELNPSQRRVVSYQNLGRRNEHNRSVRLGIILDSKPGVLRFENPGQSSLGLHITGRRRRLQCRKYRATMTATEFSEKVFFMLIKHPDSSDPIGLVWSQTTIGCPT